MTLDELASLVRRMRAKQKEYFRKREQATLAESKDLERRVDDALAALEGKRTPSMFTEGEG